MNRFILLSSSLLVLLISSMLTADIKEIYQTRFFDTEIPRKVPVLIRTYPVYFSDGNTANQRDGTYRLYFFVEIQFDFLQFVYNGDKYNARAEFEFNVRNQSSNELKSLIFQTNLQEVSFEETNRKDRYHFAFDSLSIKPGRYEVIVKYRDMNGEGRQNTRDFKIYLPEVDSFHASPILLTYPGKHTPLANFSQQPSALRSYWDFNRRMGIQLNTWQEDTNEPVQIRLSIFDPKEKQDIFSIDTLLSKPKQNKTLNLEFSENLFYEQEYEINIKYFTQNDSVNQKSTLKIVWFEKPFSLWNFDMSLGPLQYIIKDEKEYEDFTSGNDEKKMARFDSFWKKQDPTPDSPFNELKYEFYSRVDSANVRYSRKRLPGWQTDIGEIYILYGNPDEVIDNSLAPIQEPFLRWIYHLEDRQLSFTFLALDGRKRYKLANVEENPIQ